MKFLTIILATIILSGAAQAAEQPTNFFFKPYVGADYQFTHVNYRDGNEDILSQNIHGGDIHIGARVHKNLGFEAGYLQTTEASKDNVLGSGLDTKVKLSGYTLDALGYLPVGDGKAELIATVGISRLKAKLDLSGAIAGTGSETETKGRIGGGAQYWLTDNLNIRGLVRYQGANFDDIAKNAIVADIGINYQF